jgi:hypothetical protein
VTYGPALFFLILPLALATWRAHRKPRFAFERLLGGREGRLQATHFVAIAVVLVPLSLYLIASGYLSGRWIFSGFSAIGAAAGVYTLVGRRGLPLVLLPIVASWALSGDWSLLAFDVCALLAAIGAGELLADILRGRELVFVAALAAVDVIVVARGLPQNAIVPALLGPAPGLAAHPPVYAGVAVGGVFLGAIDLACAVIVGSYLRRHRHRSRKRDLTVYAAAQLAMISFGLYTGLAFPATLPPLAALLATQTPEGWIAAWQRRKRRKALLLAPAFSYSSSDERPAAGLEQRLEPTLPVRGGDHSTPPLRHPERTHGHRPSAGPSAPPS